MTRSPQFFRGGPRVARQVPREAETAARKSESALGGAALRVAHAAPGRTGTRVRTSNISELHFVLFHCVELKHLEFCSSECFYRLVSVPRQVGISAPPAHLRTPYQVTSFGHLIRGSPLLAQRSELRPKEDPVRFANNRSASCPSCSCHACFHWQTLTLSMVFSCVVLIECVASLTSGRHRALSSRRRGPRDCVGQCQSSGQR